jgi:hypothetical protein
VAIHGRNALRDELLSCQPGGVPAAVAVLGAILSGIAIMEAVLRVVEILELTQATDRRCASRRATLPLLSTRIGS